VPLWGFVGLVGGVVFFGDVGGGGFGNEFGGGQRDRGVGYLFLWMPSRVVGVWGFFFGFWFLEFGGFFFDFWFGFFFLSESFGKGGTSGCWKLKGKEKRNLKEIRGENKRTVGKRQKSPQSNPRGQECQVERAQRQRSRVATG